jgi:hypothetical protein
VFAVNVEEKSPFMKAPLQVDTDRHSENATQSAAPSFLVPDEAVVMLSRQLIDRNRGAYNTLEK